MELDGKAVEVANMQRTKVVVEGVVQKSVVDCEVAGRVSVGYQRCRGSSVRISRCSLSGGFGAGERSIGSRRVHIGAQIESVCRLRNCQREARKSIEKLYCSMTRVEEAVVPGMYSTTWPRFWECLVEGAILPGSLCFQSATANYSSTSVVITESKCKI